MLRQLFSARPERANPVWTVADHSGVPTSDRPARRRELGRQNLGGVDPLKPLAEHLMRGIHVDAGDDINQIVLDHAVRIARYLYPKAYLSGASAVLLAPSVDGRLYITGQRAQRTRLRALEIIQTKAPLRSSWTPSLNVRQRFPTPSSLQSAIAGQIATLELDFNHQVTQRRSGD